MSNETITTPQTAFLQKLQNSLNNNTFVKLTLSKTANRTQELQNIYARIIEIKNKPQLSFTLRYQTKDIVKNHPFAEAMHMIGLWLGSEFLNAHLFTIEGDVFLTYNKKRKVSISTKGASIKTLPNTQHDKTKKRWVTTDRPYWVSLGICNEAGKIFKNKQDKYRQINKYIETIDSLFRASDLPEAPHIVDMGCGKGYLTFALYDYLRHSLKQKAQITGIELRQHLVDFCNDVAQKNEFKQLQFIAQDIHDYKEKTIDVLIALHACDVATDHALTKGIHADAQLIIVAPCCHKQVRKQMACTTDMQAILQYGILEERQAEMITDGIRALILEANGYKTKVFEFISTEHTPKNVMIVGIKRKQPIEEEKRATIWKRIEAIKTQFGVEYHALEQLL